MILEAIAEGATYEEAMANAKAKLGAPEDAEVFTELIAMPQKKLFGLFGGSPAKAKAWYEVPDAPVKKEAPAPKKAAPAPEKKAAPAKATNPVTPAPEKKAAPAPVKEEAPVEVEEEVTPAAPAIERTKIDVSGSESLSLAVKYLKEVLTGMGVAQADMEVFRTSEDEIIIELDCGDDYGLVIGRRGETLDSIQYLTRLVANRKKAENEYLRISINVGNYREKRKVTLRDLAKKNSEKVLKYGRNVSFEPMNPYERRIIHTAVQEIEGVVSYSVGSDSSRRVVISLAEGVKPTHPSKGGYGRGGRGGKGGRGGYGKGRGGKGGPRGAKAPATTAPTREPRTDAGAEKVSLYGKIN